MTLRRMFGVILCACFATGCKTLDESLTESRAREAEIGEFRGKTEFWGHANAGFLALEKRDYVAAQCHYLRAYRNTGVPLLGPQPKPNPVTWHSFAVGTLGVYPQAHAHTEALDKLTPPPGVGPATNQVLDEPNLYWRSMAAYDWAIATGHLGDFEAAERAFLYALNLERVRAAQGRGDAARYVTMRLYELARLYSAWSKSDLALQYYRQAMTNTPETAKATDPVGFSYALDEFAAELARNGDATEATRVTEQANQLRRDNPNKKSKYRPQPYPKFTRP